MKLHGMDFGDGLLGEYGRSHRKHKQSNVSR